MILNENKTDNMLKLFSEALNKENKPLKESVEENLVSDIVDFMYDYDTYDFNDNYESKEEAFNQVVSDISSKNGVDSVIKVFMSIKDEADEEGYDKDALESILARLNNLKETLTEGTLNESDDVDESTLSREAIKFGKDYDGIYEKMIDADREYGSNYGTIGTINPNNPYEKILKDIGNILDDISSDNSEKDNLDDVRVLYDLGTPDQKQKLKNLVNIDLSEGSLKESKENPLNIDENKYRSGLTKIISLLNDKAFKIGEYGELQLPKDNKELSWLMRRTQEVQEALEDFKGFLMNVN